MIQLALGFLTHRAEIEAMVPRVERAIKDIEQLWPRVEATMQQTMKLANDVHALAAKVAPELITSPGAAAPQQPQQQFPPTYDVRWLQQSLNTLIDVGLVVDGVYGNMTMAAVKKFQEQNGLDPDGWAGVRTEAAIDAALRSRA